MAGAETGAPLALPLAVRFPLSMLLVVLKVRANRGVGDGNIDGSMCGSGTRYCRTAVLPRCRARHRVGRRTTSARLQVRRMIAEEELASDHRLEALEALKCYQRQDFEAIFK